MNDIQTRSIEAHKKTRGKISIAGTMDIKNKDDLSIAYTPGVAGPCLFIKDNPSSARDMVAVKNMVAVVTDGSAVLGLGNIGALASLPVMEGKALIFKQFANINAFPIALATQDTEEIIKTVKNIAPTFGGINLEDISAPRCFEIEKRLREELNIPVMHDDQHGTAIVVLAGLINALRLRDSNAKEMRVVVNGAGAAGIAITKLLLAYGYEYITLCDTKGAIYKDRADLNDEKIKMTEVTNVEHRAGLLGEIIAGADIFIGVSKADVLTKEMVSSMAPRPIIFAMANPNPEILPDNAKKAGAFIVATGRSDFPNQVNNALVFPGLFKGALDNGLKRFDHSLFIKAAEALASVIKNPDTEHILPSPFDEGVVAAVAEAMK
ncbi:MAG: NADP-dependent malic enzyme [Patescibacteria group bacterium]